MLSIDVLEMTVNELLTEEEAVIGVECTEKVGEDRLKRQVHTASLIHPIVPYSCSIVLRTLDHRSRRMLQ